jgi:MEMO1 family protein
MLTFAAFTPHPLIAIPEIGKSHTVNVRHTIRALRTIAQELHASKPDTVCIISPHAPTADNAFSINQRPRVRVEFRAFGDLVDSLAYDNDIGLGYQIREQVEDTQAMILTDEEILDYGAGVPLWYMHKVKAADMLPVTPIGTSTRSLAEHYTLGTQIDTIIGQATKRIAVIATGDLASGASHTSPLPYSKDAAAFNKQVRSHFETDNMQGLRDITDADIGSLSECGMRPLMVLLGILGDRSYGAHVIGFETALGVGYLTAQFTLR